jgi:Flp pilus assembly protein TadD
MNMGSVQFGTLPMNAVPSARDLGLLEAASRMMAMEPVDARALLAYAVVLADHDYVQAKPYLTRHMRLDPGNAVATFLIGLMAHQHDDGDYARVCLYAAMGLAPDFADPYKSLAMLALVDRRDDNAEWLFTHALTLDPLDGIMLLNYGTLLQKRRRYDEAMELLSRALHTHPEPALVHCRMGAVCQDQGRMVDAVVHLREALVLDENQLESHVRLSSIFMLQGRTAEAHYHRTQAGRRAHHVIEPCATGMAEGRVLILAATNNADLPVDYLIDGGRFDKIFIFPGANDSDPREFVERLPAFDVVFNAIADADAGPLDLNAAGRLAPFLGHEMLNPTDKVWRTRRHLATDLFAGIDGLILPTAELASYAALDRMAGRHNPPFGRLLVRPAGAHGGDALELVDGPDQLAQYLTRYKSLDYFLTEFFDFASTDGLYRKYRFIFVDRIAYPYHLAIMDHWKVHYHRAQMDLSEAKKREEEMFLTDYAQVFTGAAANALQAIGAAMDLDYAGIDCALMPDGRVLLFEANPAMLVHLMDSPIDFPYKHREVPKIRNAMSDMLLKAGRR